MPADIDYDEKGQPRIKRQPYGNAGTSMFNRRLAPTAQRVTPSQGSAGTSAFNRRVGTGGASPARTEARFQPSVNTGPGFDRQARELATRAGVAGSMLGRQAGDFLGRIAETEPYEAGASTRGAIGRGLEAMQREPPVSQPPPSEPWRFGNVAGGVARTAGQFGAGLLGLERDTETAEEASPTPSGGLIDDAQARVTGSAARSPGARTGFEEAPGYQRGQGPLITQGNAPAQAYPQGQGPQISHGNIAPGAPGPTGDALESVIQAVPWKGQEVSLGPSERQDLTPAPSSDYIIGPSGRQVEIPKPGTGWVVGPGGQRMNIDTRGQQPAPAQQAAPAQRGPAAFQETPIPPMPQPPQFGTAGGRNRDNPFAQSQAFINDMTRYLGQLSQRKAALAERARRSTSATEAEKHRKEMDKIDAEIAKSKRTPPSYSKGEVTTEDENLNKRTEPVWFDENTREFIRLPERERTKQITWTPEQIEEINRESQEKLSSGEWTLEQINARREEYGLPPFLG